MFKIGCLKTTMTLQRNPNTTARCKFLRSVERGYLHTSIAFLDAIGQMLEKMTSLTLESRKNVVHCAMITKKHVTGHLCHNKKLQSSIHKCDLRRKTSFCDITLKTTPCTTKCE